MHATAILTYVGSAARLTAFSLTRLLNELGSYSLEFFLAVGAAGLVILILLFIRKMSFLAQKLLTKDFGETIIRRDVLIPSFAGVFGICCIMRLDRDACACPILANTFLAQSCISIAQVVCYPALMGMIIRYVSDAKRSTAMGLHQSVYVNGMFTVPWLNGLLARTIGIRPTLGATAIVCLAFNAALMHQSGKGK